MLGKTIRNISVLMAMFLLVGCVGLQPKIDVDPAFWANKEQVIGVAVAKLPTPMSAKSGNQGLLDVLINDANSSDLDKHLAALDISSVNTLADKITDYLNQKNIKAVKIDDIIDDSTLPELPALSEEQSKSGKQFAQRDFTGLKAQHQVDKVLLIKVTRVGTMRSYYGFIPTSAPVGSSVISGQIINLSDNHLEWSQVATQNVPNAESEWDVPPDFPGLTKAALSAYEQSQQMLLNTFMQ